MPPALISRPAFIQEPILIARRIHRNVDVCTYYDGPPCPLTERYETAVEIISLEGSGLVTTFESTSPQPP